MSTNTSDLLPLLDQSGPFTEMDGIPVLVPKPEATLAGWMNRWNAWRLRLHKEREGIERAKTQELLPLTVQRLEKQSRALEEQDRFISNWLAPLQPQSKPVSILDEVLAGRLPYNLSLIGYEGNIHRDWCWGEEENRLSLECLESVGLAKPGVTLVLGAGWGRLAYDLSEKHNPSQLVATDINPLCLLVAKKLFAGQTLRLHEFPLAPVSHDKTSVLRELKAPRPAKGRIHLALMDYSAPAFREGAFDTIVTPWLVDVVPEDFRTFALRMNAWLKPGGSWFEFGSLAFSRADAALNYSKEEVEAILKETGFELAASEEKEIPYLRSPDSRHCRQEQVWAFRAVKQATLPMPAPRATHPAWARDPSLPIPTQLAFTAAHATHVLFGELLALVDGKKGIADLAAHLTAKYSLDPARALEAVTHYLATLTEQAETKTP